MYQLQKGNIFRSLKTADGKLHFECKVTGSMWGPKSSATQTPTQSKVKPAENLFPCLCFYYLKGSLSYSCQPLWTQNAFLTQKDPALILSSPLDLSNSHHYLDSQIPTAWGAGQQLVVPIGMPAAASKSERSAGKNTFQHYCCLLHPRALLTQDKPQTSPAFGLIHLQSQHCPDVPPCKH